MTNTTISNNIANSGDSLNEDNGNGDAGDFFNDGSGSSSKELFEDVPVKKADSSQKNSNPKKDDAKEIKPKAILNKADDKKNNPKPKQGNDY